MDRNGNIVTIRVHDNNVSGKSFASGKEISKMYNLRSDHFIVTRYYWLKIMPKNIDQNRIKYIFSPLTFSENWN